MNLPQDLYSYSAFHRDAERYPGDYDDALSSGQISPICESHTRVYLPLQVWYESLNSCESLSADARPSKLSKIFREASADSSALNLNLSADLERKMAASNQKRPWGNRLYQSRISSWSDPISARDGLDGDSDAEGQGQTKGQASGRSQLGKGTVLGNGAENEGQFVEEPESYFKEHSPKRRLLWQDANRCVEDFNPIFSTCLTVGFFFFL